MSIEAWKTLWTALLIGASALFAVLAVVVGIGGFRDVFELFRRFEQQSPDSND